MSQNRGDRFIPLRLPTDIHFLTALSQPPITSTTFKNLAKIRYHSSNYQHLLKSVLFPQQQQQSSRILNFHHQANASNNSIPDYPSSWPCYSRRKPQIEAPVKILDMPDFDSNIDYHITDWSRRNCIAAIYENEVHFFNPMSEFRDKSETYRRVNYCIKWHKDGVRIALGLMYGKVGIWCLDEKKMLSESICCKKLCEVINLEWVNSDFLITGCSKGFITLRNCKLQVLRKIRITNTSIIKVAGSCKSNFLAAWSMEKNVYFWKLPNLESFSMISLHGNVTAFAWHPWRESILVVGYTCLQEEGHVDFWNINTKKIIAEEKSTYKISSIDALTFHPCTAELVISYFMKIENDKQVSIITVLGDVNKIVEELHLHTGHVRYLMWGGVNGQFLASVGEDEHLCIWKFFENQPETAINRTTSSLFATIR